MRDSIHTAPTSWILGVWKREKRIKLKDEIFADIYNIKLTECGV